MIESVCETGSPLEPGGSLVDGVHDHQSSCDRFAGEDGHTQGIGQQPRAQAGTLLGSHR